MKMDQEVWKDIVGRPRWWFLVVPVLVVFVLVMSMWVLPESQGSTPVRGDEQRVAEQPVAEQRVEDTEQARCCATWLQAKRHARKFRNGKFGNSRGLHLPDRIQRMVRADISARGVQRGDDGPWWREALQGTACIAGPRFHGACIAGQDRINELAERTARVTVICSGAALIGFLGRGGAWGAGRGGLACLWARLIGLWD